MSRFASIAVVGFTVSVFACSGFGSDNPSPDPNPDAGATGPDNGLPPVGTDPARGLTLTIGDGKPLFVIQTRATSIPLKLERRASSTGAVAVTVAKLPKDATADPLTIPAGATDGTLILHAAASTPQGPFALELTAIESATNGTAATAKLDAFVRGLPGTLDTTFGDGGVVKQVFGSPTSGASDVSVMQNGAVVVAGHRTNNLALVRYTPAGTLDTTFGSGSGRSNVINMQGSLSLDIHEGKTSAEGFISCVSSGTITAQVCRTKLDGTPDTTFNNTGQASLALGLGNLNGVQTFALPNGNALVLTNHFGASKLAAVSRWKPDGTLDTTYGTSGTCQLTGAGTGSEVAGTTGMLLRPDGSVRVELTLANGQGAMKGCSANGALDPTLGTAPDHFQAVGPGAIASNIDGGILFLTATSWSRVNAGFVRDTGIGSFGAVSTAPITNAGSLIVQPDGAVVVSGEVSTGTGGSFTLIRFKPNGAHDPDFGTAGVATIPISTNLATPGKLIAQPDGRLLIVGKQDDNFEGVVARVWH